MTTPIVAMHDVQTYLGGHWVLQDVNLSVMPDEIFCIVGGSGSGKSTVLRQMLGLLKPTHGIVKVYDKNIATLSYADYQGLCRKWGVLFQGGALFTSLTVLENITFLLREFTDLSRVARDELALLKIMLTGLPKEASVKYPAELSGGMIKRAGLARALSLDPHLLFLDEPTSGLDPESIEGFCKLIKKLKTLLNLTIIMVTHDLHTLWELSDRVAFLGDKTLLACDTVEKLSTNNNRLIYKFFHETVTKNKSAQHGN